MDVIRKTARDLEVRPNLTDYERARAQFHWSDLPALCEGMGPGRCNIAYAALDRQAAGPAATRTALRFVADQTRDGAVSTRDLSYAELDRLAKRFSSVLRSLGIDKGKRVFTIMGRTPELYIAMMGALRNGSVVSPLFSAFGPEPIATRVNIGQADVLVTTRAIYRRKIAKIRDRLPSVRHVFVVDEGGTTGPVTRRTERSTSGSGSTRPTTTRRSSRPPPTTRRCCTSPAAPPARRRAPSTCTARSPCTTSPACTRSTCIPTTSIGAQRIPAG